MVSYLKKLLELWQQLLKKWLNRRIPATPQLQLSHRSIFIMPTRFGILFLLLLLVMLLTAINYQNSLIYGLTFWLFSLALISMLLTFRNLAGVKVRAGSVQPCFVDDAVALPITFMAHKRSHEAMRISRPQKTGVFLRVERHSEREVRLYHTPHSRGRLQVGRLIIESYFPFGLFRAWSWVQLEFHGVVYPKPEATPMQLAPGADQQQLEAAGQLSNGHQEFQGLRKYQSGDSLKQIAWKQLARGRGLVSKEYADELSGEFIFSYQALAGLPVETRLSRLCAWLLEAHELGHSYALEMPNKIYPMSHSEQHLQQCLSALALFNEVDNA